MRKKIAMLLGIVAALCCAFAFAACSLPSEPGDKPDNEPAPHDHVWTTDWTVGDTTHYHACTVSDCTAKNDETAHDFTNGDCICGKPHEHVLANGWKMGETTHYRACVWEQCDLKLFPRAHDYTNGNCVCGKPHEHVWTTDWTVGETTHYHACAWNECDGKKDETAHDFINGDCVCGSKKPSLSYKLSEDKEFFICTGLGNVKDTDIVIESRIKDKNGVAKPVTSIGNSAFAFCGLTSITIPDSITSIGGFAFGECSRLTSINYTGDIAGWCAISGLSNIMSAGRTLYIDGKEITGELIIPDSVTSIGDRVFYNCSKLTSITIPNSVTSIGGYAFYNCSGLTSITIPDSVTSIGSEAFSGCPIENATIPTLAISYIPKSNLKTVVITSGDSIGYRAFEDCIRLTSITIPDSVTSIGDRVFYNCSKLTSITIPNSVTSIGGYAFYNCSGLTSITIPDTVTSIGNSAFEDCPIENASIPALAAKSIRSSNLKTVVITSGDSIGSDAFRGCSELMSITIPDSVTSIGSSAFYNCSGLIRVTIGNSVTSIGYGVFYNCSRLTSITIPDSVTSIGSSAFYGCPIENASIPALAAKSIRSSNLKTVVITSGDSIDYLAFYGCSGLTSITIPDSVTSIGYEAFENCSGLTSITYAGDIAHWCEINGLNYLNHSIVYIGNQKLQEMTSITIPDSVTSIGSEAFYGCSKLTSITIPDSVTSIGKDAFYGCSIENATIPTLATSYIPKSKLKTVVITSGDYIDNFRGCSGLTSITIPDSVSFIGGLAFYNCSNLTGINYMGDIAGWCAISGLDNLMGYGMANKTLYIDGKEITGELVIPDSVTSIGGYAFYNCSKLTSIIIPDSVTSIGGLAFYNCSNLTGINYMGDIAGWCAISGLGNLMYYGETGKTLYLDGKEITGHLTVPDCVTSIGSSAFGGCSGLTSITIPDCVTSIGSGAFNGCPIENATIPTLAISYMKNSNLKTVVITSGDSIGSDAFRGCSELTSITIPDSVTSIGSGAFNGCPIENATIPALAISCIENSNLKSVVITSGTSIGYRAFYGCSGLTSITIGNSVTSIGQEAFYNCSNLTSINYTGDIAGWCAISGLGNLMYYGETGKTLYVDGKEITGELIIPDSVISIGDYAFVSRRKLTSIIIPDSVTSIGESAFLSCWALTSITIPDSVTSIGDYAFYDCLGLTSIAIPNSVTSIGSGVFGVCKLTSIIIPDSVTSIGDSAFEYCSRLTSITIPDTVTSIGSGAFDGCPIENATIPTLATSYIPQSKLKTVVITSGDSIGGYAFYNCSGLTSITIPNSVTSIGGYAFYNCSGLTSITIPDSVTSIGSGAFSGCSGLMSINYTGDIAGWCAISGLSNIMSAGRTLYIDGKEITGHLTIPDSVTSIGDRVFYNCSKLTSITIPNSVTSIGSSAFYGCSGLTRITIPDSVTSIGNSAFSGCSGLISITIPDSVTSIGYRAFEDCSWLMSITIPNSVTSIGYRAFEDCIRLTSITIPYSVTSIGSEAFSGCPIENATIPTLAISYIPKSKLKTVFITSGTPIGENAFKDCSGLTSVTILDSVTSLGNYAFYGCSGLTEINFCGTKVQWQAIEKGSNWNYNTGNYTVHCTDGDWSKSES